MSNEQMKTLEEIRLRIEQHREYAVKCLRIIRTNPALALGSCIGLSNALNQIEELEWSIGIKHDYEAILTIEKKEDIVEYE